MAIHPMSSKMKVKDGKKKYSDEYHHPKEKIVQLTNHLPENLFNSDCEILELFAGVGGEGNLTRWYRDYIGNVTSLDKSTTGDSFRYIHKLIYEQKKYDVIDIDPYGWPNGLFPDVFKLMKNECILALTFPRPGTCVLTKTIESKYEMFWNSSRPTEGSIVGSIVDEAKKYWFMPSLLDYRRISSIWRFMFHCKRINADVITGKLPDTIKLKKYAE